MIRRDGGPVRIRVTVLVVLGFLLSISGIGPATAQAQPVGTSAAGFTLKSRLNDRCLDIKDVNPNAGAVVQMWDCWDTPAQRWHWNGRQLRSDLNDKCLDIKDINANPGAVVQMWDCWNTAAQYWYWSGETLRSQLNGKCLDIKDINPNAGARVQMWDCWTIASQRWF